jgi:hypothetical protein
MAANASEARGEHRFLRPLLRKEQLLHSSTQSQFSLQTTYGGWDVDHRSPR